MTIENEDTVTVSAAFQLFLQRPGRGVSTKAKFRTKFKLFLIQYGAHDISAITHQIIEEFFEWMEQRRGFSDGHLAIHRSCHRTFWSYAKKEGYSTINPSETLKNYSATPAHVVVADDNDVEKAIRACDRMVLTLRDQRDAAIFALGSTGLRRSNVAAVRLSDMRRALAEPVHFESQEFYILNTGGKEPMESILDERLACIVRRYLENRPSTLHDRFFVNLNVTHKSYLKPLSDEGMIRARRRVCAVANVPLISFQKMRRLTGTKVARRFGLEVAASVLGHRSGIEVIRRHYYDPDKEAARMAAFTALSRGKNWAKD